MKREILLFQQKRVLLMRHFRNIYPYITLMKFSNLIISILEFVLRKERLISKPSFLKIETSRRCNLRCPACSHSINNYEIINKSDYLLTLADVKKIIDPMQKYLLFVALTLQGEALCNNDLIPIIEYIHKKKIGTSFPTNFSMKLSEPYLEKLVLSGLDTIMISLDGTNKESYNKYRIGGNFNLILQNVKTLSEIKKKLNRKRPKVIWKFIIFPHNRNEINYLKQKYSELGFDSYNLIHDEYSKEDLYLRLKNVYKQKRISKKKVCFWLWMTTIINWEGVVYPCTKQAHNMGNALNESFKKIWNNEKYRLLRKGFSKVNFGKNMDDKCYKCQGFLDD